LNRKKKGKRSDYNDLLQKEEGKNAVRLPQGRARKGAATPAWRRGEIG